MCKNGKIINKKIYFPRKFVKITKYYLEQHGPPMACQYMFKQ